MSAANTTGSPNYISRGRYDDWSIEDILEHLSHVGHEEGGKPTKAMLWRRINEEGKDEPSPRFISSRIPFRAALELIGYPNIYAWTKEDYRDWGVKYLKANDAILPTASSIDYLSLLKRGPSAAQVGNVFGRINNFKTDIWDYYYQTIEKESFYRNSRLSAIGEAVKTGELGDALMENADSEDEIISRFARFQVARELLPQTDDEYLIKDCIPTVGRSFTAKLRRRNERLSAGEIESTALCLGVFDDIWPPSRQYMNTLKVPAEFIEPRRLKLSALKLALR